MQVTLCASQLLFAGLVRPLSNVGAPNEHVAYDAVQVK